MNINEIMQYDQSYFMNTFGKRIPVAFSKGDGIHLYTEDGQIYTDFFSGIAVNSLGYNNQALINAITEQAKNLIHCSNYYYVEKQAHLAKELCERTFADKVFFSNSGAEANEAAIKLARAYFSKKGIKKHKIISLNSSFHGRTLATLAATGTESYQRPFLPLPEGFLKANYDKIEEIEKIFTEDNEICAVIIEPIMGEGGVHPHKNSYLKTLRDLCDKHNVLLIFDEVQTGICRTGSFYAYMDTGVTPDILTSAKALGGGMPIGACLATDKVASAFEPGDHGSTYIGGPVSCAAALAVLSECDRLNLCDNAKKIGDYLIAELNKLKNKYTDIKEIRGRGLMIGIQFDKINAADVKNQFFGQNYLVGTAGGNTLRLLPPLIINQTDVDQFIKTFDNILQGGL